MTKVSSLQSMQQEELCAKVFLQREQSGMEVLVRTISQSVGCLTSLNVGVFLYLLLQPTIESSANIMHDAKRRSLIKTLSFLLARPCRVGQMGRLEMGLGKLVLPSIKPNHPYQEEASICSPPSSYVAVYVESIAFKWLAEASATYGWSSNFVSKG